MGDLVYVKLVLYRSKSLLKRENEKMPPSYFGPYTIVQHVGPVVYKLVLRNAARVHPVFHVSQLKTTIGANKPSQEIPPVLQDDLEWKVELETILSL